MNSSQIVSASGVVRDGRHRLGLQQEPENDQLAHDRWVDGVQ